MIGLDRIHMLRSDPGTVLKRGGGSGGVQPSLHRLQTQCSHDGLGKDSVL